MCDLRGDDGLQLSGSGQSDALALPSVGRAAGKAILVGEHFVVHGAPALAVPVPIHIEVRLARLSSPATAVRSGSAVGLGGLEAMLRELGLEEVFQSIDVEIAGPLPLGAGLGGSAALAAAFSLAWGRASGVEPTEPAGLELAAAIHRLERIAHGNPSGLDGMTVALGRPVWFAGTRPASFEEEPAAAARRATLEARYGRAANATVLEGGRWVSALEIAGDPVAGEPGARATGPSASLPLTVAVVPRHGTTREAVAGVAAWKAKHSEAFEAMMHETVALAQVVRDALTTGDWPTLGRALDAAHTPLKALGLVSDVQERMVTAAREAGAYGAKMSGAGLGGAIVIVGPEGLDFESVLRQAGAVQVFTTTSNQAGPPASGFTPGPKTVTSA